MATETVAMVGTRKGLWIGRSDERRETWTWDGPHFDMQEVYSCMVDTRGGRTRLLAGAASSWVGPSGASSQSTRSSGTATYATASERRRCTATAGVDPCSRRSASSTWPAAWSS